MYHTSPTSNMSQMLDKSNTSHTPHTRYYTIESTYFVKKKFGHCGPETKCYIFSLRDKYKWNAKEILILLVTFVLKIEK